MESFLCYSNFLKKGDWFIVSNYRSIFKISILPKLFTKLVTKIISQFFERIICNEQSGFRKGRSTILNLCIFKQSIVDAFSDKAQLDVVYTIILTFKNHLTK